MSDYISRVALKESFDNADADVCEIYPDGYCDWGFGRKNVNDIIAAIPTVDAVPLSELTALRDTLYDMDAITFRGLAKLNQLISKYGGQGISNTIPDERR